MHPGNPTEQVSSFLSPIIEQVEYTFLNQCTFRQNDPSSGSCRSFDVVPLETEVMTSLFFHSVCLFIFYVSMKIVEFEEDNIIAKVVKMFKYHTCIYLKK